VLAHADALSGDPRGTHQEGTGWDVEELALRLEQEFEARRPGHAHGGVHAGSRGPQPNAEPAPRRRRIHLQGNNLREAFPDHHRTIEFTILEQDFVVTHWTASGTHAQMFLGIAPTENRISITGINIHRFQREKMVELWSEFDALALLSQLAVPLLLTPSVGSAQHS
jgi:SnoaL-like polyketide cyclase